MRGLAFAVTTPAKTACISSAKALVMEALSWSYPTGSVEAFGVWIAMSSATTKPSGVSIIVLSPCLREKSGATRFCGTPSGAWPWRVSGGVVVTVSPRALATP